MVGASISGVTFVSVPGMVLHSDMTYLQTCMGFILGYFVVAYVLLPIYYRMNVTSIYTVLRGVSDEAYKTGAAIFIFSKLLGSAAKFFVPCYIISSMLDSHFCLTTVCLFLLIWLYTRKGGIKTLVWTDTVQTMCMLAALLIILYNVYGALFNSQFTIHSFQMLSRQIGASGYSRIFEFDDWGSPHNFFKCFISGIFIVIVMTGLDQDMMQKNLTCKSLRDAQKDMCTYGFAFLPVNALFLVLGIMLTMLYAKQGMALPEKPDALLSGYVFGGGELLVAVFLIGIMSTSFSTIDSSLTALTTSFCVDIMDKEQDEGLRRRVHFLMAVMLIICTMAFGMFNTTSLIDTIYQLVSYTYGPLLGLFAYSLYPSLSKGRGGTPPPGGVRGYCRLIPLICLASPLVCFALDTYVPQFTGYHFGYELLLINGTITYLLLVVMSLTPITPLTSKQKQ